MIRLIGDVHGYYDSYLAITQYAEYSIQLGDFGFEYSLLSKLNHEKHKVLLGNHDHYGRIPQLYALPDFGMCKLNDIEFFCIRGAYSVDKQYRTQFLDWWPEEQLNIQQCYECLDLFKQVKPELVLSHDCPFVLYKDVLRPGNRWPVRPTITNMLLDECFKSHQPQRWFFAHHHNSWQGTVNKTRFRCLDELEFVDI